MDLLIQPGTQGSAVQIEEAWIYDKWDVWRDAWEVW